jgi:hypothetical protein
MRYLPLIALLLCSCQGLQLFNLWPKPTYSQLEHYKAQVMASGTMARSAERVEYVLTHRPPNDSKKALQDAIDWPDLLTAGKLP